MLEHIRISPIFNIVDLYPYQGQVSKDEDQPVNDIQWKIQIPMVNPL